MLLRRGVSLPTRGRSTALLAAALTVVVGLGAVALVGLPWTGALFTNQTPVDADLGAGRIFRGERDTPAFSVTDTSSGSAVDGSARYAFAADGRYFTSYAWAASFDGGRHLEFDLNGPLPAGLAASNGQLTLRFAGDSGGTTTCVYVEIRRASTGAEVSSHGSAGSPLACSSGTTYATASPALGSISSTDLANDLRIRVYASDSSSGPLRVDAATISGDTPYSSFTLYPVLTRDTHDSQTDTIRWGLAGS